jgi:hypothetical protein
VTWRCSKQRTYMRNRHMGAADGHSTRAAHTQLLLGTCVPRTPFCSSRNSPAAERHTSGSLCTFNPAE